VYAELKLTLKKPLSRQLVLARLQEVIGANTMDIAEAVRDSPIEEIAGFALIAEQIVPRAKIIYLLRGSDYVVANILAKSLRQLREECSRISRQLPDEKMKVGAITASILVEVNDTYSDILIGEKISFKRRLWEALCDKFWGKFLPALITAGAAVHFLANTPAVNSAIIGLVAATAGALLEAALSARAGASWKWKEST